MRFAALVKLRSSATARNAERTLSSSRTIVHFQSTALADCTGYTGLAGAVTLFSAKRSNISGLQETSPVVEQGLFTPGDVGVSDASYCPLRGARHPV